MAKHARKVYSVKNELINKSRESMLTAVQIFNNPNIQFKSESFIILIVIAWTYMLHAYYRQKKVEYRYFEKKGKRRIFDRTKNKAYKYWELERCLNDNECPIDSATKTNLLFLIGLRHEIEHQMTTRLDDMISGRFQACCLNYNDYFRKLFGHEHGMEKNQSFSLQFSSISEKQNKLLADIDILPKNIASYIEKFDEEVTDEDFNSSRFSYKVILLKKTVNHKNQADKAIEFLDPESDLAKGLNREFWAIKDREKPKYLPSHIWEEMKKLGYSRFGQHQHTQLWKSEKAKDPSKGYGVNVEGTWYWYESWLTHVKEHCKINENMYS